MDNQIVISHLCQSYGKKVALSDVSFTISQGMFGLLGRNGAGKTTLMRTVTGLMAPKGGTVTVCGIPFDHVADIRAVTGYLPQDFSMYPSMTVWEALDYLGVLSAMPSALRKQRIPELLERVNLSDRAKTKVRSLSGGMKRRLGIAQALLHDPQVVIADEPTAGLDPEERVRFRELFRELSKEKTVLFSTHIISDMEEACDNIAVLDQGRLLYAGSTDGLLQHTGTGNLEQAYLSCIHSKEVEV